MKVVSSLYLAGAKTKLIQDILPHLQDGNRTTLLTPFTGTGVVELNCIQQDLFEEYYSNDFEEWVVRLHNKLKDPSFILECKSVNEQYPSDKESYLKMRLDYNNGKCKDDTLLFNLLMRSHSNRMRFSGQGSKLKCNIPYGERNRYDMTRMLKHHTLSQKMNVAQGGFATFLNQMSKSVDWSKTTIYSDPPYFGTTAVYNSGWSKLDDEVFRNNMLKYKLLGAKVVFSNIFSNRDFVATDLINWCGENKEHFEVHHLNMDYSNTSHVKYEGKKTDEVLIVSK